MSNKGFDEKEEQLLVIEDGDSGVQGSSSLAESDSVLEMP